MDQSGINLIFLKNYLVKKKDTLNLRTFIIYYFSSLKSASSYFLYTSYISYKTFKMSRNYL